MLHAVIMAGGRGTRFWPQSRNTLPKQLLRLAGEHTMIQSTALRVQPDVTADRIWVVTNRDQAGETAKQLPDVDATRILIEPCGRNTAPCVAFAAACLIQQDPEAIMLVMPADHVISPPEVFRAAAERAVKVIKKSPESLVLFGVPPTYPATGFGYIERGPAMGTVPGAFQVAAFKEKPDRPRAEEFVAAGRFYWNCGIFVWKAATILAALDEHHPEIAQRAREIAATHGQPNFEATLNEQFPQMTSISIDHAVLEHTQSAVVIEAPFDWDDVGSWEALPRLIGCDAAGNAVDALHCGVETSNSIVRSTNPEHLLATFGVDNLIIVHTPDATLVANRNDPEAVKRLVSELEQRGHGTFL